MSLDDDLRQALDAAAPPRPNPASARAHLAGTMTRARRVRRVRVATISTTLALASLTGTALAIGQLSNPDTTEIGPSNPLPTPDAPPATDLPEPPSNEAQPPAATSPASTTDTTPEPEPDPGTTPTTQSEVDETPPATTTADPEESATTTQPAETLMLSGPHETDCGSVTFEYSETTVEIESRTVEFGYRFTTEGDGSPELHAKWDEGAGTECQVEAHLEDGVLRVQLDEEPS